MAGISVMLNLCFGCIPKSDMACKACLANKKRRKERLERLRQLKETNAIKRQELNKNASPKVRYTDASGNDG